MTHKTAILLLIFLLCAIGATTGYRYYRYVNEDPAFCSLCHVTEEGYRSWEKSEHYRIICQECHKMSVLEGNKLLMSYYVKGGKDIEQEHGRKLPWQACQECHGREAAQGSITFRASYGHARHVFMQDVGCERCHAGSLHTFTVDSVNCRACHSDKLVHGMGTAGLYCLNCHSFAEAEFKMTSSERCYNCHAGIPRSGVMSRLECHECHHPHETLTMESKDCLGTCHSSETKVGQHKIHIERASLQCTDCHKPHSWAVEKKNARGLCDKCHPLKDPMTFIY